MCVCVREGRGRTSPQNVHATKCATSMTRPTAVITPRRYMFTPSVACTCCVYLPMLITFKRRSKRRRRTTLDSCVNPPPCVPWSSVVRSPRDTVVRVLTGIDDIMSKANHVVK